MNFNLEAALIVIAATAMPLVFGAVFLGTLPLLTWIEDRIGKTAGFICMMVGLGAITAVLVGLIV